MWRYKQKQAKMSTLKINSLDIKLVPQLKALLIYFAYAEMNKLIVSDGPQFIHCAKVCIAANTSILVGAFLQTF